MKFTGVGQGSIKQAVTMAREAGGVFVKIEVETRSYEEAVEAIESGADIVMLDNFSSDEMRIAARDLKSKYPNVLLEVSGGITPDNLLSFACPNVDVISMGALTQGVPHVDFSLKINK